MSEVETETTTTGAGAESTSSTQETVDTSSTATAGDSGAGEAVTDAMAAGSTAGGEQKPAWTPNFKFTVKDKEQEFDEWLRPVVKNKEVEEKIRDLYTKAYGIEEVKAERQTLKQKYSELEERSSKIDQSLQVLGQYVRKGDYRSFFESLKIPKEQVIKFALDELKYLELPEEDRQRIEAERAMKEQLSQYEYENMSLQQQQAQLVAKQVGRELSYELEKPEISQVAQSFDTRVGKPGAFREEVLKRGAYYEAIHKQSPPPQQVVTEVAQLVGAQMAAQGQQSFAQQTPGVQTPAVPQAKKPVIPSFNGSGSASPTRKVPTSIEDLRKIRANLAQQG